MSMNDDEGRYKDDRDMDLDDDLFPDSRRVRFEDLDQDQSWRIDGVTFAGEPLTEDLCDEYTHVDEDHERNKEPCMIRFAVPSLVQARRMRMAEGQTRPKFTLRPSRFSILNEDVSTSGREVKIKTRRTMRKDDRRTTVKHKSVCRTLDACARITSNARNDGLCQCLTCTRAFAMVTTKILREARSLGILRKNRGRRWTYDRWTNTIEAAPKFTFRRLPSPRIPSWVRPLPCPPVATDEVLSVPVNLRVLDPILAKNVRLALRLFGRYVLPTRVCYEDLNACEHRSCLCPWMPALERFVDPWMPALERFVDRDPREQVKYGRARDEYERTFLDRLKYAPKVLISAHEMRVTLPRYETSAEAKYLTLHRSDRGQFSSIVYGEAMTPFEFEGKQGQAGDRVALWHYGRGQTTIAARTPRKDAPPVQIAHRTAQGRRKAPTRPGHARTPARPRTGPAKNVPGHAPGLGPERAAGVVLREIHSGSLVPIQFLAPILILTRVAVRNWARC